MDRSGKYILLCLALLVIALFVPSASPAATMPSLPKGISGQLEIGLTDKPGGAQTLKDDVGAGYRYQYLSGGLNTGKGWSTWNENGTFVDKYIQESQAADITPLFSYYMIRQSLPGINIDEPAGVYQNLRTPQTMKLFFEDLELFFIRSGKHSTPVIFQVEPDMWGYIQKSAPANDAVKFAVSVSGSGARGAQGFSNNAQGMARAIKAMRDEHAPNVILAYPISVWGTNVDISHSNPTEIEVDALAQKSVVFYRSLNTNFDITTAEFSDKDSAYKVAHEGQGDMAWWDDQDFHNHARYLRQFSSRTKKHIILWQIPLGNTKMRAMDNTLGHYQDNRVEWLLGANSKEHLKEYLDSGVIALLFGGGVKESTCACDSQNDGITNGLAAAPGLLNSLSADDDGGYFRMLTRKYYQRGSLALPVTIAQLTTTKFTSKTTVGKLQTRPSYVQMKVTARGSKLSKVNVRIDLYHQNKRITSRVYKNQWLRAKKTYTYTPKIYASKYFKKGRYTVRVTFSSNNINVYTNKRAGYVYLR